MSLEEEMKKYQWQPLNLKNKQELAEMIHKSVKTVERFLTEMRQTKFAVFICEELKLIDYIGFLEFIKYKQMQHEKVL